MACKCQCCGTDYKVDFNIPDVLWDKITNDENLLCGSCITRKIEQISDYSAYKIHKI